MIKAIEINRFLIGSSLFPPLTSLHLLCSDKLDPQLLCVDSGTSRLDSNFCFIVSRCGTYSCGVLDRKDSQLGHNTPTRADTST